MCTQVKSSQRIAVFDAEVVGRTGKRICEGFIYSMNCNGCNIEYSLLNRIHEISEYNVMLVVIKFAQCICDFRIHALRSDENVCIMRIVKGFRQIHISDELKHQFTICFISKSEHY